MANKRKKKLTHSSKTQVIKTDEGSRTGFDYSLVQELSLGKIISIEVEFITNKYRDGGIKLKFENGYELHLYHPENCCESVFLHEDIKNYKELIGQHLHSLSIVAGVNPAVGGWYYAKMSTTEGNFYNFSFDGDEGSGCYSMELVARFCESLSEEELSHGRFYKPIWYKGKEMTIQVG